MKKTKDARQEMFKSLETVVLMIGGFGKALHLLFTVYYIHIFSPKKKKKKFSTK